MGKMRDPWDQWLRLYAEFKPQLARANRAFNAIEKRKRITAKLLAPIVEAASNPRASLFKNAIELLAKLADQYLEAQEAVLAMVRDPHWNVRFNAICCLEKPTPLAMTLQMLRKGLRDRSAKVRWKAADRALYLGVRELVPELERADAFEKHEAAKTEISYSLSLLRDGYSLRQWPDGGFAVSTFTTNGISARKVSQSELRRRGIETIVAEIARRKTPE
jgi:hypothetical protein